MCRRLTNEEGFTLIEALLQMVVLLIASSLLFLITQTLVRYDRETERIHMNWELFIYDFQEHLQQSKKVVIQQQGKQLLLEKGHEFFYVNQSKEMIRGSLNSGNEILFVGIRSVSFEKNGRTVTISAQLLDGTRKERMFIAAVDE